MDIHFFELLIGAFTTLLSAVVGVLWGKADNAEKIAESNRATLNHIEKQLYKTSELTERLSSLEASFATEIKNIAVSIKRMESMIVRLEHLNRKP